MASESKTEKATPKKRKDERKKGNVFQSKDIINAVSVFCIFIVLKLLFPFIYKQLELLIVRFINYIKDITTLTPKLVMEFLYNGIVALVLIAGPTMLVAMAVGIIASGVQTRFNYSKDNVKLKFSRISPMQGFKRLFSMRSVVELVKSLLKVIVIGFVFFNKFKELSHNFAKLISVDIIQGIGFILTSIMDIVIQISMVFAVIAFLDFLYQWWEYEKNLRMTKQEIKEEYKHLEGNPEIKGKIKEKQRQISMQRMMQQVPNADVIIRNPTHFAVALKYDIEKNMAPIVIAKGQDYVALKIIEIAAEHNIPTTENRPLARALYENVEVNREIPPEYYSVLAEIMAWVYTLKKGN